MHIFEISSPDPLGQIKDRIILKMKIFFFLITKMMIHLSNELFFFERCSLITATACAYKFICMHRSSYETASFEKEQFIGYIYISKPLPSTHFLILKNF